MCEEVQDGDVPEHDGGDDVPYAYDLLCDGYGTDRRRNAGVSALRHEPPRDHDVRVNLLGGAAHRCDVRENDVRENEGPLHFATLKGLRSPGSGRDL